MTTFRTNGLKSALLASSAMVMAATLPYATAVAQDADDEELIVLEQIVVTGSRIRRDSFTSAAPIQTMDVGAARQIGVNSISELLQRSTIANGQQINADLNTNAGNSNASEPPPLGGVGSANIGLRGLEPARTLVLINSKRLGSSGVRGAPAQPDLNLIPFSLVERIEVITEGASSVYGADAVAGVVNLILRNEFEGLEISSGYEMPFDSGGEVFNMSFITGAQSDRAKFVLAGEFYNRKRVAVSDRRDCIESHVRDAASGELQPVWCSLGFFDNIVWSGGSPQPAGHSSSWFFFTPDQMTDTGIPNFQSALSLPSPSDPGRDCRRTDQRCRGLGPIAFYSGQEDRLRGDLIQPTTRFSTVALASYSPEFWDANEEFYFETYYMNRHAFARGGIEQIFPTVHPTIRQLDDAGNVIVDAMGVPIMVDNPLSPFPNFSVPIITLEPLRQDRDVEVQHFRFVGGFRGDFPNDYLGDRNWTYDFFMTYDRGAGAVEQPLLSENALIQATQNLAMLPDGTVTCDIPITDIFGFTTPQTCVPIDFFAPSLYQGSAENTGEFATEEELDYLVGSRVNRTVVEQFMTGIGFTGDVMDLPAGAMGMALGAEFRRDSINSFADFISAKSINAGENPLAEGATKGTRDIYDAYMEVNVPLVSGKEMIDYLGIEGAVRYTDEENFGSEVTYRGRFTYRPNDWMQFSGSYGTSFRAPNLRETFLAAQFQGTSSSGDPCGVPVNANDSGVYNPAAESRTATTLANCIQSGADPTALGLVANINIPVIISGNAQSLTAETSRSYTATFQMSPPISNSFEVDFAVSFFDIEIKDAIRSIDPVTIMGRCFEGPANLESPFCSRITRTLTGNPNFDFVSAVDASFVNVGSETSQGFDINARIRTSFDNIFEGGPLDVSWSGALTIQTKREESIFIEEDAEDMLGTFGFPERRFTSTLSLAYDRFEFLWDLRHLSGGRTEDDQRNAADCDTVDDFLSRVGPNQLILVCDAPGAWYNDASMTYRMDAVTITIGMNNIFDKTPPLVSIGAGSNRANMVTSSGYDQLGRTGFINLTASF